MMVAVTTRGRGPVEHVVDAAQSSVFLATRQRRRCRRPKRRLIILSRQAGYSASVSSLRKQGRGRVSSASAARHSHCSRRRGRRSRQAHKKGRVVGSACGVGVYLLRHRVAVDVQLKDARVRILSDKICGRARARLNGTPLLRRAGWTASQMGLKQSRTHRALVRSTSHAEMERRGGEVWLRRRVDEHLKEGTTSFLPTTSFCPPIENKTKIL